VILNIFANPYSLARFDDTENIEALLISYQDNKQSQEVSAEVIFGGIGAGGRLPVTASEKFPVNCGVNTPKTRLQFSYPEEANVSSDLLKKVDTIAMLGIDKKAYPGCQVLAAKDGKVIYYKSFGYHTYDKKLPVKRDDIYDLASVTKIAAATISVMRLSDDGKLDIDHRLKKYLPYIAGSNKEDIIIREMMAHQARLRSWIPFYFKTIKKGKLDTSIYSSTKTSVYSLRVAENLYMNSNYADTVFKWITVSKLRKKSDYLYSDLGFYLLKDIIQNVSGEPLDEYVYNTFYKPLNLQTTGYSPRKYFSLQRIVPTEKDTVFRKQVVHGDVHDPGAAMLGGVCGHAGLFSNAYDLAVILQMFLDSGVYGGKRYIKQETIKEFTKLQYPLNDNRRGIGFDKPLIDYQDNGPTCKSASRSSFGHSGFTGIYVWVDPEVKLVYIFLSNRVYPDSENKNIYKYNIRTEIHQVLYDAIMDKPKKQEEN